MIRTRWVPVSSALGIGLVCAASLVACGSSAHSDAAAKTTATPTASSSSSGRRGGFGSEFSDPKVQQCLRAAGIAIPSSTRSLRPDTSGQPRPSFTGARPSGSRGAGGFFGGKDGTQIQAALKACGIAVPTFSRPAGAGQPPVSAAPTA